MAHREQEQFRVLFLDRKNADRRRGAGAGHRGPRAGLSARGGQAGAGAERLGADPRPQPPSATPRRRQADIDMTSRSRRRRRRSASTLHDHLIIGRERELSFRRGAAVSGGAPSAARPDLHPAGGRRPPGPLPAPSRPSGSASPKLATRSPTAAGQGRAQRRAQCDLDRARPLAPSSGSRRRPAASENPARSEPTARPSARRHLGREREDEALRRASSAAPWSKRKVVESGCAPRAPGPGAAARRAAPRGPPRRWRRRGARLLGQMDRHGLGPHETRPPQRELGVGRGRESRTPAPGREAAHRARRERGSVRGSPRPAPRSRAAPGQAAGPGEDQGLRLAEPSKGRTPSASGSAATAAASTASSGSRITAGARACPVAPRTSASNPCATAEPSGPRWSRIGAASPPRSAQEVASPAKAGAGSGRSSAARWPRPVAATSACAPSGRRRAPRPRAGRAASRRPPARRARGPGPGARGRPRPRGGPPRRRPEVAARSVTARTGRPPRARS